MVSPLVLLFGSVSLSLSITIYSFVSFLFYEQNELICDGCVGSMELGRTKEVYLSVFTIFK